MTNTTEEYWDVDGTSLNTYAFNIETLGGRSGVPQWRGSNIKIPYKHGEQHRPKFAGPRTLSLAMWVRDTAADGTQPTTEQARRTGWNENMAALKALFFKTDPVTDASVTLTLTRRWRMNAGLITANAEVELLSTMEPTMLGRFASKLIVDLNMLDPYFYDTTNPAVRYL